MRTQIATFKYCIIIVLGRSCFWFDVMVHGYGRVHSRWIETRGCGGPLGRHSCIAPFWASNTDFAYNASLYSRKTGQQRRLGFTKPDFGN